MGTQPLDYPEKWQETDTCNLSNQKAEPGESLLFWDYVSDVRSQKPFKKKKSRLGLVTQDCNSSHQESKKQDYKFKAWQNLQSRTCLKHTQTVQLNT